MLGALRQGAFGAGCALRRSYCAASKLTGIVKWYNPTKGYGFIVQDKDGSDIFVHQTSIEMDGFRQLYQGDQVEYEVHETERGPQTAAVYIKMSNAPPGEYDDASH